MEGMENIKNASNILFILGSIIQKRQLYKKNESKNINKYLLIMVFVIFKIKNGL